MYSCAIDYTDSVSGVFKLETSFDDGTDNCFQKWLNIF